MANLGTTDLDVHPICLGGNVFGWTADRDDTFAVLDAYTAAGGNFVDTADSYSHWVPGHTGGESETLIGEWMTARGTRDDMVVATKVRGRLTAENVREHAEASLRRLQTDRIDLYYAHYDDPETPLEETLGAFDALVRDGKVRYVAASNFTADRLAEALAVAEREGFARFVALQPHYNLLERDYEAELQPLCQREAIACLPYFALARGFLTGKYRPGTTVDSPRAEGAAAYLDARGEAVLAALDELSAAHGVSHAAIALAWLAQQPTVAAPIASARNVEQLRDLLQMTQVRLSGDDLARLDAASLTPVS